MFSCGRIKQRLLKTITSRSWIPVNAHAPIKDGTGYSCMLTDKTNSKTQRVDADFLENGQKISKFKQNQIRVVWALEHWHKKFITNEMIFVFCIEYRKIPKISPGAYIRREICVSKSARLILGGKYASRNPLG